MEKAKMYYLACEPYAVFTIDGKTYARKVISHDSEKRTLKVRFNKEIKEMAYYM